MLVYPFSHQLNAGLPVYHGYPSEFQWKVNTLQPITDFLRHVHEAAAFWRVSSSGMHNKWPDVASKLRDKSFLKSVRASPLIMFDQDFPQRCHQYAEVLPSPPRPRYFGSTELPIVPTAWEISWRNWSTWRHALGMGEDIKNWETGIYKNDQKWIYLVYMILYDHIWKKAKVIQFLVGSEDESASLLLNFDGRMLLATTFFGAQLTVTTWEPVQCPLSQKGSHLGLVPGFNPGDLITGAGYIYLSTNVEKTWHNRYQQVFPCIPHISQIWSFCGFYISIISRTSAVQDDLGTDSRPQEGWRTPLWCGVSAGQGWLRGCGMTHCPRLMAQGIGS